MVGGSMPTLGKIKEYYRSHLLDLAFIIIGGIVALMTIYCDYVVLSYLGFHPLYMKRIFVEGVIPSHMSILPPEGLVIFAHPVIITYKPLSPADLFSLYFPLVYLGFLIIEVFRCHRWKKSH